MFGFLFLPFTTLMYVFLKQGVGTIQGLDWLWLFLAVILDIASIGAAGATNRNRIPAGYPGSYAEKEYVAPAPVQPTAVTQPAPAPPHPGRTRPADGTEAAINKDRAPRKEARRDGTLRINPGGRASSKRAITAGPMMRNRMNEGTQSG